MAELNEFESKVKAWLDTPKDERTIEVGATLMLQANRNRILFQNVMRKSNFEKVEYELRKFIGTKLDLHAPEPDTGENLDEGPDDEQPKTGENLDGKGMRKDHDSLPEDVQKLYFVNSEKYALMRSLHEKLKILSEPGHTDEERAPLVKELADLDKEVRENWNAYDQFDPSKQAGKPEKTEPDPNADIKKIQANRTYLSRKAKKTELDAIEKEETAKRYAELLKSGQTVDEKLIEKLIALGVSIEVGE